MNPLRPYDSLVPLQGMRVIFTEQALEKTEERLFPASKHRSRRIRKKLIKRFGSEFRMKPAMFTANGILFCHPVNKPLLEQAVGCQL